jgi:hypothetical protein
MTCSGRCSGRRAAPLLALFAAAACGHAARAPQRAALQHAPGALPRVLLLPVQNIPAAPAPTDELLAAAAARLAGRLELVSGEVLEKFLVKHRLRDTGGIDLEAARAARTELGADAILVTSLELYRAGDPPVLALAMRLVATGDEPTILWMDSVAHSGDEAPGLLGLGRVTSFARITERVVGELAGSLAAFLDGRAAPARCGADRWRAPHVRFRSKLLDGEGRRTLAVVPFLNLTQRSGAGDAVALEFVRQLVASGRYRVLEPGVVRGYLLRARVIMPGGVSLETTRMLLGGLGVEAVVSGLVLDYEETYGREGPTIRFGATLLDGDSGEVLWNSSSFSRGDDGVFFFGLGRVGNSQELACRMVSGVVSRMNRPGGLVLERSAREQRIGPARMDGSRDRARAQGAAGSGAGNGR